MAISVSISNFDVAGNKRHHSGTVTFDSSYPTGGESFTASSFGLSSLDRLDIYPKSGYVFEVDYTNSKILAYSQGFRTGSTAASTSADGALVENDAAAEGAFRAYGTAVDTDYKIGAMKEVANTVNLSAVAARFVAVGS